jgi:hypothetical protein
MFASSILHICVFLVSFGIIKHLEHADTGNMKIYSPTSIIFPSSVALGEYDCVDKFSYVPHQHAINV